MSPVPAPTPVEPDGFVVTGSPDDGDLPIFNESTGEWEAAPGSDLQTLPMFGAYAASGLYGYPTFYDPTKAAWNSVNSTGTTRTRTIHHSGGASDDYLWAASADLTPAQVNAYRKVNASTLVDGRASYANHGGYVEATSGEYVNMEVGANVDANGANRFAGLYLDADNIVHYMLLGIDDAGTKFWFMPTTGQTVPIIRTYKVDGTTVAFEVGIDGLPVILSPNSTRYRIKVDNAGALSTEAA